MIKTFYITSFLIFSLIFSSKPLFGQIPGEELPQFNPDSIIVFRSPRPLLTIDELKELKNQGAGIDAAFNWHGFALGGFYRRYVNDDVTLFLEAFISGAKVTDELETFNPFIGDFIVPYKINRLFSIPFMIGMQYNMFNDLIAESFRPYVGGAIGYSLIISTPYVQNRQLLRPDGTLSPKVGFFQSFGQAEFYHAPGGYISIGAGFGKDPFRIYDFSIRYYYIPFSQGLESIENYPVTQFGGISINFRVGLKF